MEGLYGFCFIQDSDPDMTRPAGNSILGVWVGAHTMLFIQAVITNPEHIAKCFLNNVLPFVYTSTNFLIHLHVRKLSLIFLMTMLFRWYISFDLYVQTAQIMVINEIYQYISECMQSLLTGNNSFVLTSNMFHFVNLK